MAGIPIFIEVESTRNQADTQLCCKIMSALTAAQIGPLGLAGTLEELNALLASIHEQGLAPSIFVVNTFGAKEIIPSLDPLMGELPVLYLRRRMFAGQSGLMANVRVPASPTQTAVLLSGMKPRLTSFWFYGAKNANPVAQRATRALTSFIQDGNFRHIEIMNDTSGR